MASSVLIENNNSRPCVRHRCPVNELPLYYAECAKNPDMDLTEKMKYEIIRYSTFSSYNRNSCISFMKLSRAGFYYDVFSDSVKCFQCKYTYDIYNDSNDDPMEIHFKHSPNCTFVRENYDASHKASGEVRQETRCPAVVGGASGGPSDIRHSASYPNQTVSKESTTSTSMNALTHTSENLSVVTDRNGYSMNTTTSLSTPSPQPRISTGQAISSQNQHKKEEIFNSLGICIDKPKYPKYAILATRLASFKTWSKSTIVSPDELAHAGFFYYGSKDQVVCFFCGGGLEEWDAGDTPWTEHEQWFPNCAFVKQCKGAEIVTQVHGQRREANTSEEKFEEFCKTAAFQSVAEIGYTKEQIKEAYDKKNCTESILSADQLLELLWRSEGSDQKGCSENENTEKQSRIPVETKQDEKNNERKIETMKNCNNLDLKELIAEHEKLKEQSMCKVCMDEDAVVVFLPCGHMCTCVHCAPAMRKCPICRQFVKGTVKAILS